MAQASKPTILDHFADLDDPRVERTRRHKLVAIDGKTARRSYDRAGKKGAIHPVSSTGQAMVSAWATQESLPLIAQGAETWAGQTPT